MLGRRAGDIIARAFTQPGHDLSYQYVTLAEQGGRVVGMASGYTAEAHRHSTEEPLTAAAGWRRYRMAAFTRFTRRMVRFIDTVPDGDFYGPAHRRELPAVEPAALGKLPSFGLSG